MAARQRPAASRCARIPIGAVGANFEARPNVAVDVAGQLLKSPERARCCARAARRSARSPCSSTRCCARRSTDAGLPPAAVGLVRSPDREGARILVSLPERAAARDPARQRRDDGGARARGGRSTACARSRTPRAAVSSISAPPPTRRRRRRSSRRASTGSASATASTCCSSTARPRRRPALPRARAARHRGARAGAHRPRVGERPRAHRVGHRARRRLARRGGRARERRDVGARRDDRHRGRGGGASASSTVYRGTAAFWNATTRFTDGFALTGAPETGINVDRVPGPRGPVTYRDL